MLPFFYHSTLTEKQQQLVLDETTSKHCIQVLRMQEGEQMMLTNGLGIKALVTIVAADRKRCGVQVVSSEKIEPVPYTFTLAIAFTKNNARNEWLLEKTTEIGIQNIVPIITARTEKEKFNLDRLNSILVSAMLQSQQCFLPQLCPPISLKNLVEKYKGEHQKLIAHCIDEQDKNAYAQYLQPQQNTIVLIGPEGDFTQQEVDLCMANGYTPVSLGSNRLRTETAGLYVCTIFNALNYA